MTFEESKRNKLKRLRGLRIMNALGMVAWRPGKYSGADQKLRLVHPLVWVWLAIVVVYGTFSQGIPETVRELRHTLKNTAVWF